MNIKTTINVLFRVVLLTTMTFVMSIQTAGAQTKDPVEEAFLADSEKASLLNEDVRKGGRLFGMAPKAAIPLFEKAINSSNPTVRRVAIISAALCYDTMKDYQKAEQLLLKLAQQGDAYAQNLLGLFYDKQKDYQKAVQWFTKAAKQGSSGAQFNLAHCYYNGEGVAKDYQKAVQWYTKAAEQGDAEAQFNLALCYSKGEGVPKDYQKAVHWYTKSAEQGIADAQNNLALRYWNGEGVAKDYQKAVQWFTKAAGQGNAKAQLHLG